MEQHPVPRQITTFEFKLIGFMTLKQFLYLLVFVPFGFVLWRVIPIPYLNIVIAAITIFAGFAFAFVPINDITLDVWVKNFIRRLNSPTQFVFHKHNPAIYFLQNLYFVTDPHKVMAHVESREKLAAYLAATTQQQTANPQRQQVATMLQQATSQLQPTEPVKSVKPVESVKSADNNTSLTSLTNSTNFNQFQPVATVSQPIRPFFIGVVKNNKKIPLPGIMIYVKDQNNATVRLLKTNPHGVFATYSKLPPREYSFEVKDPKDGYFFDTMKFTVQETNTQPFEIYSKELL